MGRKSATEHIINSILLEIVTLFTENVSLVVDCDLGRLFEFEFVLSLIKLTPPTTNISRHKPAHYKVAQIKKT